jgi:hypothetical protein
MHVASRQNPNWVWGTFEHQMNPGRCDYSGCVDTFGAQSAVVLPNRTTYNTQYGKCEKTPALKALMQKANLSPVWQNYCLKSTEVDFTAPDGTPYVLENSVVEGIVGKRYSRCIVLHLVPCVCIIRIDGRANNSGEQHIAVQSDRQTHTDRVGWLEDVRIQLGLLTQQR